MKYVSDPLKFRQSILDELGFQGTAEKNYTLYRNPDSSQSGSLHLYQREGLYDFGIADYTITHPFTKQFHNPMQLLRFGIVNDGTTRFRIGTQPVSSFMPSSFLVLENNIKGEQSWKSGQHFKGAEFTIYPGFIEQLKERFPLIRDIRDYFIENHTYYYLPAEIYPLFHKLMSRDREDTLNAYCLEAAVLECMGIILESGRHDGQNAFSRQVDYGYTALGGKRRIVFNAEDHKTIQKAHEILTVEFANPPTIQALSRRLLINSQKLKAGFRYYYHMTIAEYTASLKMAFAATLLCTTDKSIEEIAQETGYTYVSNFIYRFRKTYSCTPLQYRKREKRFFN